MSVTTVSSLHIYPIKSTQGIRLLQTDVEPRGLAFDRRFVIADLSGQFITARVEPTLCIVQTRLTEQGLILSASNMPTLTISYDEFSEHYQNVTVWGDEISGQSCTEAANAWFSEYLKRPCQLLFFGQKSLREKKASSKISRQLAFADGYPLLLISQASLDSLNHRLANNQQPAVLMSQFRPNIVVDNCLPFAEDGWLHIRIGEVEFMVSKPCERCILTTVNPNTGEKHFQQQPLHTLKSFRKTSDGEILFGQNLIPLNSGQIKVGDKLTVMSQQEPPTFAVEQTNVQHQADNLKKEKTITAFANNNASTTKTSRKKATVHFDKWQKDYAIPDVNNNPKTLLENGEDAGLILPYSCRAGMCGRCKAKLISGEVHQTTSDGLTAQEIQQGYILCCSATAKSDVVIKHE